MVTHVKILGQNGIQDFETPPQFNYEERKRFFYTPNWVDDVVEDLQTSTNKVGFILQYGYFCATGRFFPSKKFNLNDFEFVTRKWKLPFEEILLEVYQDRTFRRHQEVILEHLGIRKFDEHSKILLTIEALSLCSNQIKPKSIFLSLIDFLREQKIEIPSYNSLAKIITDALKRFEKELLLSLEKNISCEEKELLDELLEISQEYLKEKQNLKIKRYKITLLKKSSQSLRPSKIKENMEDFNILQTLFLELLPIIKRLELAPEIIHYYAQMVVKSQVFQISRREKNKYLYLISFVIHHYYQLNDYLIEIFLQSVQSNLNSSSKEHKELFYEKRKARSQIISNLSGKLSKHMSTLENIDKVVYWEEVSDADKVNIIKSLLQKEKERDYSKIQEEITALQKESKKIIKNDDYYDILESKSIKLQNRVSEIGVKLNI